MSEPRAKTAEEVKKELLDYIHNTVEYWAKQPDKTPQEKCDGLAFSILAIFDGVAIGLPALDIALAPHPSDKQYYIDNNENWYEPGMVINNCMLHEEWFAKHD
jgi:hypothetical protein